MAAVSPDVEARILLTLGMRPPAPAVRAFVREHGVVGAAHLITKNKALPAVQAQWTPPKADAIRVAMKYLDDPRLRYITPADPGWPHDRFADLPDELSPPLGLWIRSAGTKLTDLRRPVGVAGAEFPTDHAAQLARAVGRHVAGRGNTVVIAGFRGIPHAGLRAARATGATGAHVVVLSYGFDYFESEYHLYDAFVSAGGLVISEYPPHWPPLIGARQTADHLVGLLADCAVVIEPTDSPAHTEMANVVHARRGPVYVSLGASKSQPPDDITTMLTSGAATSLTSAEQITGAN